MKKILLLLLIVISSNEIFSQDAPAKKGKWAFLMEPYLMFPNMNGSTGIGTLPDVEVDANPGDIFSHLKIGAMLFTEMSNDKWAISSDIIYMNLEQDVKTGVLIKGGQLNAKQFAWELAALRRVSKWLELGAGTLLNSLKTEANISVAQIGGGTSNMSKSISKTWVDPMLIARIKSNNGVKKFMYQFRGEIGGFGIGSDFTWQIQAYAGYRFSKLFQLTGGYRIINIDYENGSGQGRFLYDMNTFGPVIRFGFNF